MFKNLLVSSALILLAAAIAKAQTINYPSVGGQSGDLSMKLVKVENTAHETIFYLVFPKQATEPGKDIFLTENDKTIPVSKMEKTAYSDPDSLQEKLYFPKLKKTTGIVDLFEDKANGFLFKNVKVLNFKDVMAHPFKLTDINGPATAYFFSEMYDLLLDKAQRSVLLPLEGIWRIDSIGAPDFYAYYMKGTVGKARHAIVMIQKEKSEQYSLYRLDGVLLDLTLDMSGDGASLIDMAKNSRYDITFASDTSFLLRSLDETPYAQAGKTANTDATVIFKKIGFTPQYLEKIKAAKKAKERTASGFFVSTDGYLVTGYDYVKNAAKITVYPANDGHPYNAEIAFVDKDNGLAMLQITDPNFKGLKALPYEVNFAGADLGAEVFTIGYTKDAQTIEDVELTKGYINSKSGPDHDIKQYQVNTALTVGGGAPLFDKDGNIVGITLENTSAQAASGYAVKARYLEGLMDALPKKPVMHNTMKALSQTDKIKQVAGGIVLVKVK